MSYKASVFREDDTIRLIGEAVPTFIDALRTSAETHTGNSSLGEFAVRILENIDEKASEFYTEIQVSDVRPALYAISEAERIATKRYAEMLRTHGRIRALFSTKYWELRGRSNSYSELFTSIFSTVSRSEYLGQED